MGLKFKEDVAGPFDGLTGVKEVSRKETRNGQYVSIEFIYEDKDGHQSFYLWNGMDHEAIPQTLDEAIQAITQSDNWFMDHIEGSA